MEIYDRIKYLRNKLGLTQQELADKMGYKSRSAINKIECGLRDISQSKIQAFAEALQTTTAYLMGEGDDELNAKEHSDKESKIKKILARIPLYNTPVSAGGGEWLDDGCEYTWQDVEDTSDTADFALRVRGDSMTPMYNDGDIIYIKQNMIVESGQIGVFVLNDEGYLKMLQGNRLISLNSKYKPITINDADSFFPLGRVVGKAE